MSDRGEDCVGGVALAAFEIAAAEMAVGLDVSDHGFDGGAAFELALDGTVNATLLAGDEDPAGFVVSWPRYPSHGEIWVKECYSAFHE